VATNAPCARTKILVAIDDSIPAQWALKVAASFATRLNTDIVLLTVIPSPEVVGAEVVFAGTALDYHSRLQQEAQLLLRNAHNSLPPTVPCETIVREGIAPGEILSVAHERNVDLIVLGSRGRNRFAQFVLGSTAEAVIGKAPCPVLTIANEPTCCESAPASKDSSSSRLANVAK